MLNIRFFSIVLVLLAVFTGCFWFMPEVRAVGISPPWVVNHDLLKGSHFEKTVTLTLGATQEPLHAELEIIAPPSFKNWISVKPGLEFDIPVTKQFPFTVVVDVPKDAKLGNYEGQIRIRTRPANIEGGGVTIGIGATVDLELEVIEKEIINYDVGVWKISPMEEGWPIKMQFTINNKGNVEAKPLKVEVDVYNPERTELLASLVDTDFKGVGSFKSDDIIAEFPVHLAVGSYFAEVRFYKNATEAINYTGPFEVLERGAIKKKALIIQILIGLGIALLLGFVSWLLFRFRQAMVRSFSKIRNKFTKVKEKFKKILRVLKEKEE